MKYFFSLSLFLILFTTSLQAKMTGTVRGERYYSPGKLFSVEIPYKNMNRRDIFDDSCEDSAYVVFSQPSGKGFNECSHLLGAEQIPRLVYTNKKGSLSISQKRLISNRKNKQLKNDGL